MAVPATGEFEPEDLIDNGVIVHEHITEDTTFEIQGRSITFDAGSDIALYDNGTVYYGLPAENTGFNLACGEVILTAGEYPAATNRSFVSGKSTAPYLE